MPHSVHFLKAMKKELERKNAKKAALESKKAAIDLEISIVNNEIDGVRAIIRDEQIKDAA